MSIHILFFDILKTCCMLLFGYVILRFRIPPIIYFTPTEGVLSRKGFLLRYLLLSTVLILFYASIQALTASIVILPTYWLVRSALFIGMSLSAAFYISLVARRLRDIGLNPTLSFAYTFYILFAKNYGVVQSISFFLQTIALLFFLILLALPTRPLKRKIKSS